MLLILFRPNPARPDNLCRRNIGFIEYPLVTKAVPQRVLGKNKMLARNLCELLGDLLTPETELTSHYMFCFSRDFCLEDADMSKLLYEGSRATFLEDVDFLEAVQRNRVDGSLDGLIHISADAAQLQARRMLGGMISAEQVR